MLTPIQYWRLLFENDLHDELTSSWYAEWLNRVYVDEYHYIDDPFVVDSESYSGDIIHSNPPKGRPSWFSPEDNISEFGEPLRVYGLREKFSSSWKYWEPKFDTIAADATAPIRGYVTSVGKPSFDCGIPVDSRQPKLMIRECRKTPLEPLLPKEIIERASMADISFIEKHGQLFSSSQDSFIVKYREKFFDMLGDSFFSKDTKKASAKLHKTNDKKIRYSEFVEFIKKSRERLQVAINKNNNIVFVMGHKHPDTDTVISSLFEAYRNTLLDNNTVFIPVVQSSSLPDEIARLLGELSKYVLFTDDTLYAKAKETGCVRWISVDQNFEPEVQKNVISIIDHHVVSDAAKNRDIPKTLEMVGSCASLITRKYLGMGLEPDKQTARLLYGAALMDTENRVDHKMSTFDKSIMDYLKSICQEDDDEFYADLMSRLLRTSNIDSLFARDYKEDWGFGFAVAKVQHFLKTDLPNQLFMLASHNNKKRNLPLTLVKITEYKDDFKTVHAERIYASFHNQSDECKKSVMDVLESIVRFEFPDSSIYRHTDYIEFSGGGVQLSRKKTAPVILPVIVSFNLYFYSPTISLFVKRDFQKKTALIKEPCSTDSDNRINNITFEEAKSLSTTYGFSMLSLPEYWAVYDDAKKVNDVQMLRSLEGCNFVEFLDTRVLKKSFVVHKGSNPEKVYIPSGDPGLIRPEDIDRKTGLPKIVRPPDEYGNPELWRYWQPDSNDVLFCRSFIFLLNQPCLDGKFHLGESYPNLGVRPVRKKIIPPRVACDFDNEVLRVLIDEEDSLVYSFPKNIWDW